MLEENVMIPFLKKFDLYPFRVYLNGKEYLIGEAYMDGNLEIEGDLYGALDCFPGQMGKGINNELPLVRWY